MNWNNLILMTPKDKVMFPSVWNFIWPEVWRASQRLVHNYLKLCFYSILILTFCTKVGYIIN